jgi:type I restriction enzyme S subunit
MSVDISQKTHWFGACPEHWQVVALKTVVDIQNGDWGTDPVSNDSGVDMVCYRKADFTKRSTVEDGGTTRRISRRPFVRAGDILLEKSGGGDVVPAGAVAIVTNELDAACSNFLARLRPRPQAISSRFLWRVLMAFHASPAIWSVIKQTTGIQNVDMGELGALPIPLPALEEQERIADWIDGQARRVNQQFDLLESQASLFKELRQCIRQQLALPSAKEGSAWFGEVPSNWSVERLGNLFREAGKGPTIGLPVLSVSIHSGISDRELGDEETERKVSRSEDKSLYKRVRPADLVYNQMRAWQGGFGVAKVDGLVSPAYVVARPILTRVDPAFVEHLLRTPLGVEEMRRHSRGIIDFRLRLYWQEFKDILIPLPPLIEQQRISAAIDQIIERVDVRAALTQKKLILLEEQLKAIIREGVLALGMRARSESQELVCPATH